MSVPREEPRWTTSTTLTNSGFRSRGQARGERTSGERISWDEALDTIAERLLGYKSEYGSESVGIATGTGRPYMFMALRFANAFGTPNILGYAHACYFPRVMALVITCRGPLPICDLYGLGGVHPRCVLVWGCNS